MRSFCLNVNDDVITVKSNDIDPWALPAESWTLPTDSKLSTVSILKHKPHDQNADPLEGVHEPQSDADPILSTEFKLWTPYNKKSKVEEEEKDKSDTEEGREEGNDSETANILWAPMKKIKRRSRIKKDPETDDDKESDNLSPKSDENEESVPSQSKSNEEEEEKESTSISKGNDDEKDEESEGQCILCDLVFDDEEAESDTDTDIQRQLSF